MNIYDMLNFIRKSDGREGEYTLVAETLMDLCLRGVISSQTVLKIYGEILHILVLDSSCIE